MAKPMHICQVKNSFSVVDCFQWTDLCYTFHNQGSSINQSVPIYHQLNYGNPQQTMTDVSGK
jgi:hypothetical protein